MAATPGAIVEVIERVYLLIHSFQISIFNCDLFEKDWIVRLLQHLCHRVFKATVKQRGPVLAMGGDEGLSGVGGGGVGCILRSITTFGHLNTSVQTSHMLDDPCP